MRFPAVLAVAIACLFSSQLIAQNCANGQCEFRTPVRNLAAKVVEAQPVRSTVKAAANAVGNTVEFFATNKPVRRGLAATFGVQRVSGQSACGCGCAMVGCDCQQSTGFRVGGYDSDGALITSIGEPSSPSAEVSALGVRNRRASREVILEAAQRAHDACTIDSDQLRAIKLAVKSPRMLARIEDLILERAQSSGAYSFKLDANGDVVKAAIDWNAIADFIIKIAPIIFKLIEMFALDTSIDNSVQFASVDQVPNFVATVGYYWLAC